MTKKKTTKIATTKIEDTRVEKPKVKRKKRKVVDWEAVEREYRPGQLSNAEIARRHNIVPSAVSNRATRMGWKRDLSKAVRDRTKAKVVSDLVNATDAVTDEEIIEEAANRSATLIQTHRNDINALREAETKLIAEISGDPQKTWVGQYQGVIITETYSITATERATALNALAAVQQKRIALERQAFGIDEEGNRLRDIEEIQIVFVDPSGAQFTGEDTE